MGLGMEPEPEPEMEADPTAHQPVLRRGRSSYQPDDDVDMLVRWVALEPVLSNNLDAKIYLRQRIPDLFSMGQRCDSSLFKPF